jgi:CBS domain-containing protein
MRAKNKPLTALTAGDVMTEPVIVISESTPLREAARLLLHNQVGGAPIVDDKQQCIGVLSAVDFLRMAEKRADMSRPLAPALPVTCPFQTRRCMPDGPDVVVCNLPLGVCPIQSRQRAGQHELVVCRQPNCVLVDWQIVELEKLPGDTVRHYMTADPVMIHANTPLRDVARLMIDAHVHRVVVIDDAEHPIGIVSSTDVLAAVAFHPVANPEDPGPARSALCHTQAGA